MKRIIAVLALIALLMSFTGVPRFGSSHQSPCICRPWRFGSAAGGADGRARRGETYGGGHFG